MSARNHPGIIGTAIVLVLMLSPVILATLALGGYLNYGSIRRTYEDMIGERHLSAASRIAEDAQTALSFELPLPGQTTLQPLLVREVESDRMMVSIDVVGPTGGVLFSSDPERAGPNAEMRPDNLQGRSAEIRSAFDTVEGRVVVRESRAAIEAQLDQLRSRILQTTIATAAAALAIAVVAVWVGLAWFGRRVSRTGATHSGVLVPEETLSEIETVDSAQRALESRLAGRGA